MSQDIVVPARRYPLPDDYRDYWPTPEQVYRRIVTYQRLGALPDEFEDPEEIVKAVQNFYDLGDSDADEIGLYVFENFF